MEVLGYVSSLAVGLSLGMIGGGGSILMVPILVYLFRLPAVVATGYSLFIVGVASLVGAYQYQRKGLIAVKTGILFALPAFLGVHLARRVVLPWLPNVIWSVEGFELTKDGLIMIAFAVIMLLASISMIRSRQGDTSTDPAHNQTQWLVLLGFGVGMLTGFLGAGGGFLIIPALVLFAKLPMKTAVGTSLMIIAANSLWGFLSDLVAGQAIEWTFLLSVTTIAVVGIFIGYRLSEKVSGARLKPAFGWFVLVMGFVILGMQALNG